MGERAPETEEAPKEESGIRYIIMEEVIVKELPSYPEKTDMSKEKNMSHSSGYEEPTHITYVKGLEVKVSKTFRDQKGTLWGTIEDKEIGVKTGAIPLEDEKNVYAETKIKHDLNELKIESGRIIKTVRSTPMTDKGGLLVRSEPKLGPKPGTFKISDGSRTMLNNVEHTLKPGTKVSLVGGVKNVYDSQTSGYEIPFRQISWVDDKGVTHTGWVDSRMLE